MSTILLAFEPEWFKKLSTGEKKYEYRKHFPKGNTTVYFYVSSPIKAITGIAFFGERENLNDWKIKYADRPLEVQNRIDDFLTDCRWAIPMLSFQPTNIIPLKKLQSDLPDFIIPRMYYYIDDSELLRYLNEQLEPEGEIMTYTFASLKDNDIC